MGMACRRGSTELLDFLLQIGSAVERSDDFGRTPLHDACWTASPNFDVVKLLLDKSRYLVCVADSRKSLPLTYVHQEHWAAWCRFLWQQKEVWWHPGASDDWNDHLRRNN